MAWIRLDDQIAHHPKILKCSSSACWLYVTCISYAQRMLTDGHFTDASLPLLSHVRRPRACLNELIHAGLVEKTSNGYKIHHYLDFNESAASAKARKEHDRRRKASTRNPDGHNMESGRNPNDPSRARASHPIPSSKEQKKRTVASRLSTAGNGHRKPRDNQRVIVKLIHTLLDDPTQPTAFTDLLDVAKTACARKQIAYDSTVVGSALESAIAQRQARVS